MPSYTAPRENDHLKEELRKAEEDRLRAIEQDGDRRHKDLLLRSGLGPYQDIRLRFRPTLVSRIA